MLDFARQLDLPVPRDNALVNPLWVSGHILTSVLRFMFFVVWIRTENTPHKQLGPLRYRRFTPILLVP